LRYPVAAGLPVTVVPRSYRLDQVPVVVQTSYSSPPVPEEK
jgi:hypothetical protein